MHVKLSITIENQIAVNTRKRGPAERIDGYKN